MKLVGLLCSLFLVSYAFGEDPVYIPDPNLKRVIEEALWLTDPTPTDMLSLTDIEYGTVQGISDLTGLEYATNLNVAWLAANNITDLSPLSELTNLYILYIDNNPLDADAYTTYIPQIIANNPTIDLNYDILIPNIDLKIIIENNLGVINPSVFDMQGLTDLDITNIADLRGLEHAVNLTTATICCSNLADISPLTDLENLEYLLLYYNQISDISPLVGMSNLISLDLVGNPLNTSAYCHDIPVIESNNPTATISFDANPNTLTDDCSIDLSELVIFLSSWLETNCDSSNDWCGWADLNHSNGVNIIDFANLTQLWLVSQE